MTRTVGIRFDTAGKLFKFDMNGLELAWGMQCVVQTGRGLELGRVVTREPIEDASPVAPVLRIATDEDQDLAEKWQDEAARVVKLAKQLCAQHRIPIKVVQASYTLDGRRCTVRYTSEHRADLRLLQRELSQRCYGRIEFEQVGVRDETKYMGALGRCGMQTCCSMHLDEMPPISVRMVRDQQMSLNPANITGPCGRLLCCLRYEHVQYKEMLKDYPKQGARVCSQSCGKVGRVTQANVFHHTVNVRTPEGTEEWSLEDIRTVKPGEPAPDTVPEPLLQEEPEPELPEGLEDEPGEVN
ncbi:MAG: hypothetical protein HY335_08470 [Deinococcus sp.]|nr:hypothetical protein [Deinococcus sp.]